MPQLLMGQGNVVAMSIEAAVLVAWFGNTRDIKTLGLAAATWYIYNSYVVPSLARKSGPISA